MRARENLLALGAAVVSFPIFYAVTVLAVAMRRNFAPINDAVKLLVLPSFVASVGSNVVYIRARQSL